MSRSTSGSPGIAYQPALDGVRAVAVCMVLLFHGNVAWMKGGYFGVSMFFTLSGFLITSLLVREFEFSGRIAPKAFYARRLRRLMPASLVCLTAVSLLGAFDVWKGVTHLRRDILGALFQVANWVQLAAGESYTDLQSRNAGIISPLDHYWSLAIEEQFYWVWPLAFWGMARMARRRGWGLDMIVAALAGAFAVAAPIIALVWGRDAAYWASPARAAEILVGAWLAVALARGRIRPGHWMAPVGALGALALAVVLPAAGGPAYHGAFPALAIVTGLLILGLQQPGPVVRVLAAKPLVALGKVSYGVYLYHFPTYVLMTSARVGQSGFSLLVLRLVATLTVAVLSYWVLERPIRFGRTTSGRTVARSAFATAGVFGLVLLVPAGGAVVYYAPNADLAEAAAIQPIGSDQPLLVAGPAPTVAGSTIAASSIAPASIAPPPNSATASTTGGDAATAPSGSIAENRPTTTSTNQPAIQAALTRPARILVVGDSTAEATGAGLVAWAAAHPDLAQVSLAVAPGCGFVRGGEVPSDGDEPFQVRCDELLDDELPDALVALQPDVVMMMVSSRDVVPRQWNDEEGLLDPRDARYVARIRTGYEAVAQLILSSTSARIVWVRAPVIDAFWLGKPHPFTDPELVQIREDVMRDTIRDHADRSQLLDLRSWMEATGLALDHDVRPDGLHFSPTASLDVAQTWLGPELLLAATENAGYLASLATG